MNEMKIPSNINHLNLVVASTYLGALSLHASKLVPKDATNDEGAKTIDKAYDLALTYKEGHGRLRCCIRTLRRKLAISGERDGFRVAGAYKITPDLNFGGIYQIAYNMIQNVYSILLMHKYLVVHGSVQVCSKNFSTWSGILP